ncbi:succinylglutamate desuccinylase/aspartoacylase family protein [Haladaptatus sp. DYF46]|uniref:M99 family carboxypeptidase catalytic domain-containing protein n=1 Tax=Haladaptatus sp. DYF46 TaxID=2886041 RepID=UPI001E3B1A75|nr:succinylglutamate desuccinylase/aspartoacylase family protein [Haladaptatus sp. DYF46]
MRRRSLLSKAGVFLAGSTAMSVAGSGLESPEPSYRILPETKYETGVFVREGADDGPTAMVVGGIHGDEQCGYRAANDIAGWQIDRGKLVVLPKANRVAIRKNRREGEHGDLNRQFPTGEEPETELARAIWNVVERHDPDVVLDLHRSVGIYGYHESSVGQVIWPTDAGNASEYANRTTKELNGSVVPWYMPFHEYRRGGELDGSRPMLVHKVAGELDRPGYIVETTEFFLDADTRVRWERAAATDLLSRHGIEQRGDS